MSNNIDKFDILTGRVLAKLYENFPIKTELYSENFRCKSFEEELFFDATVDYLIENDIITATLQSAANYYNARLTIRGLSLLKSVPKSIDERDKNIGERLKEAISISKDEAIKLVTNALFGLGAEMFK